MRALVALVILATWILSARSADAKWLSVTSGNLTVMGDQSPGRLKEIAEQIIQFRAAVGLVLPGARTLATPTTLYVFTDDRASQPYYPMGSSGPRAAAGVFTRSAESARMWANLASYDQAAMVLFHEFTHMLLSGASARVPLWLNEGMADYFSTFRYLPGDRRAELGRPNSARLRVLRDKTLIPIRQLLTVDQRSPLYNEEDRASIFYGQSWALVHYIIAEVPNGAASINRYIDSLSKGTAQEQAFEEAFGASTIEFDRRIKEYIQRFSFKVQFFVFKEELQAPELNSPVEMNASDVEARLGELQIRLGRLKEGIPRIEAAARNAQGPRPNVVLGQLRIQQKQIDDALRAFGKALAADPNDFAALYAYGIAVAAYPKEAASVGIQQPEAAALTALTKAAEMNPLASETFFALSAIHLSQRKLQEAWNAIERAVVLSPGRLDYRLRMADVLIANGSTEEAKTVLSSIVAANEQSAIGKTARTRLGQIEQRK